MHHILVWPLADHIKIIFQSKKADLSTITCCDSLAIVLQKSDTFIDVVQHLSGCGLSSLQTDLQQFMQKKIDKVHFHNLFFLTEQSDGTILLKLKLIDQSETECLIDWDMIKGWIAQLELLAVLMEENENEQKSRGKGCC